MQLRFSHDGERFTLTVKKNTAILTYPGLGRRECAEVTGPKGAKLSLRVGDYEKDAGHIIGFVIADENRSERWVEVNVAPTRYVVEVWSYKGATNGQGPLETYEGGNSLFDSGTVVTDGSGAETWQMLKYAVTTALEMLNDALEAIA